MVFSSGPFLVDGCTWFTLGQHRFWEPYTGFVNVALRFCRRVL